MVSSAKRCASLLLRLRPIGLALRATPAAPLQWLRSILLMAQPPLFCEEGNDAMFSIGAAPGMALATTAVFRRRRSPRGPSALQPGLCRRS